MNARLIDEMHVIHARRAGRHAGEAGEAAVDMLDRLPIGRLALLEHVLDEIDAAARAVELIAEEHISRAGGGAESAMHAFAQDHIGGCDMRIGKLLGGETGLDSY